MPRYQIGEWLQYTAGFGSFFQIGSVEPLSSENQKNRIWYELLEESSGVQICRSEEELDRDFKRVETEPSAI